MRALLQRVTNASVYVDGICISQIDRGLLVFLGIEVNDTLAIGKKLVDKILQYRLFADAENKMNLSLNDVRGDLLLVSQFTLVADTQKGLRPSFSSAMSPDTSKKLYHDLVQYAKAQHASSGKVADGEFGANMQVSLINDGPVTFWFETKA